MISEYKDIFNARGHLYNSASAMSPFARKNELKALLNLIDFSSDSVICDVPAGGGYVAEGIKRLELSYKQIVCVEPAQEFSKEIPECFEVMSERADRISKPNGYFTVIASLAGLHHVFDRTSIFNEWSRLSHSGGQIVVADVAQGTGAAEFLNGFVDQFSPQGHKGWFFSDNEFSSLLSQSGLKVISDQLVYVPWIFSSTDEMAKFCYLLFGMKAVTYHEIISELEKVVGISETHDGKVKLHWQLQYAKGIKS